ncbi:hypothetical protein, partial [Spirulina sp. 06S082]|uniref:hypothetical protein n=1 Tax=Spirulina sp. 06S082 TaxID=3110248 RepID=UPI002B218ACC
KPVILAEALQYYFSGANEDPIYNMAVVLDTGGYQLSQPPIKLAQSLANVYKSTNGQWDKHIGWSLEEIPPRAIKKIDILATALDSLIAIPDSFDFFRGWALQQLAPLLHEYGLLDEAIIIAVGSLSNQFQTRTETIEVLTHLQNKSDDLLENLYPENTLFQAIQTIDDPYLRFRGYLRLRQYFPFLNILISVESDELSGMRLNFWETFASPLDFKPEIDDLIASAREVALIIEDSSQQEWAFEQLAQIDPLTSKFQWLQQAIRVAGKISDSENRARAYTRLANSFPLKEGLNLFLTALNDIEKISDERKKVETLVLVRKFLNRYPQAASRFQKIVDSLDSWNQAKSFRLTAPLVQWYATKLGEINTTASWAWERLKNSPKTIANIDLAEENFFTKRQNILTVLQENEDSDTVRKILASVGKLHLVNQAFYKRIESASILVEEKPYLLEILIDWLEQKLQEGLFKSWDDLNYLMIGDILGVVAACAERLPNTFYKKATNSSTLKVRLSEAVQYHNTFPGRQSALILLSYFYDVTEETIFALKAGLQDVVAVQDVVIQTVDRYREIDLDLLRELFEDLLNPSPAIGFVTARMLVSVARNMYTPPSLREEIIEAFVEAIDDDRSKQDVYLFLNKAGSFTNCDYQIEYKGQLDVIFYEIVTQLSGITNLGKRSKQVSKDDSI